MYILYIYTDRPYNLKPLTKIPTFPDTCILTRWKLRVYAASFAGKCRICVTSSLNQIVSQVLAQLNHQSLVSFPQVHNILALCLRLPVMATLYLIKQNPGH